MTTRIFAGIMAIACFVTAFNLVLYRLTTRRQRELGRAVPDHSHPGPGSHPILGAREPEPDDRTDAVDTSTDEGTDPGVVLEPVKAWKHARAIRGANGTIMFTGMSYGSYGVESVATCATTGNYTAYGTRNGSHHAPAEDCTCGFYARNEPVLPYGDMVALEVELYGKVIPYEKGYRAEKQRVLSVMAMPCCQVMAEHGYIIDHRSGYGAQGSVQCGARAKYQRDGVLMCAEHAVESGRRFFEWEPEPVNCETEWRWYDPDA